MSETIRKHFIANFTGVDFWTSPYTNGTVDFMISPKEYTRVVRHLQHEKIPFKVNKKCVKSLLKECYLDIHMLKGQMAYGVSNARVQNRATFSDDFSANLK